LGKNYPAKVAILGEPKTTLPELTAAVLAARTGQAMQQAAQRLEQLRAEGIASLRRLHAQAETLAGRQPIHPLALMQAIGRLLPPDAVVIDETISSGSGLRRFLKSDDPQSFFGMRGGGIGWGLPAAIGAKLALPHRPLVALIGDGSAMYTIQGLWTAAREKLPMVFVIINNHSYRILKQRTNAMQQLAAQTDTYVGMELEHPSIDFVSVARGLGVTAQRATTLSDMQDMLRQALAHDGPTLIDVEVDRTWKPV
jgi:benzoylformate decarboxylase